MRRTNRHMNRANQVIGNFGELVKKQYGFVSNPSLPLWKRVEIRFGEMNVEELMLRPTNMACHNLLPDGVVVPRGTNSLLGLGLNYCIKPSLSNNINIKHTFTRLKEDMRRLYALRDNEEEGGYIPSLYIKSKYKFVPASDELELALSTFEQAVINKQEECKRRHRKRPRRNLTRRKWNLIQSLRRNDKYFVTDCDKNLGPVIMLREEYIERGISEHLSNERNYKKLNKDEAMDLHYQLKRRYRIFIEKYRPREEEEAPVDYTCISKPEATFLGRSLQDNPDQLSRFRQTIKIHKDPYKMRPIICCAGTFMNAWSKWLDYWLQKLKHHVPTYTKDSQQILDETKSIQLPSNALLFSADANSMYNNIDTDHAIEVITWWLKDLADRKLLPERFPLEAVLEAMVVIMKNNIFEWGDLYFLQLLGTAMGTSAAVMWATIYFAYHEAHTLIPKHGQKLLYFRRFIDDIFGIWIGNTTTDWVEFCNDVDNFGILTWDIKQQRLTTSVVFLDLTLSIEGNRIVTRTFQKKMNLFLYLPAASAHPPNCIKGTIYGLVGRYYAQNTYRKDYVYFCKLLYRNLVARGWTREYIRQVINEASKNIEGKAALPTTANTSSPSNECKPNPLYIHMQYHPDGISRKQVRELYEVHCKELFEEELKITSFTLAYSRPKNTRDYVSQAKLHQAEGRTSSTIMGEHYQGLNP